MVPNCGILSLSFSPFTIFKGETLPQAPTFLFNCTHEERPLQVHNSAAKVYMVYKEMNYLLHNKCTKYPCMKPKVASLAKKEDQYVILSFQPKHHNRSLLENISKAFHHLQISLLQPMRNSDTLATSCRTHIASGEFVNYELKSQLGRV